MVKNYTKKSFRADIGHSSVQEKNTNRVELALTILKDSGILLLMSCWNMSKQIDIRHSEVSVRLVFLAMLPPRVLSKLELHVMSHTSLVDGATTGLRAYLAGDIAPLQQLLLTHVLQCSALPPRAVNSWELHAHLFPHPDEGATTPRTATTGLCLRCLSRVPRKLNKVVQQAKSQMSLVDGMLFLPLLLLIKHVLLVKQNCASEERRRWRLRQDRSTQAQVFLPLVRTFLETHCLSPMPVLPLRDDSRARTFLETRLPWWRGGSGPPPFDLIRKR